MSTSDSEILQLERLQDKLEDFIREGPLSKKENEWAEISAIVREWETILARANSGEYKEFIEFTMNSDMRKLRMQINSLHGLGIAGIQMVTSKYDQTLDTQKAFREAQTAFLLKQNGNILPT